MIYLQKMVIDHIEYSISLGWGVAKEPESSIDMALLVEGALLKACPDRQDVTLKVQNGLQAATNNSVCTRL
jgi:hypothetical protein